MTLVQLVSLDALKEMALDRERVDQMEDEDVTKLLLGLRDLYPAMNGLRLHTAETISKIGPGASRDLLMGVVHRANELDKPVRPVKSIKR